MLSFLTVTLGQEKDIEFEKKNFKDAKKEFRDAVRSLSEGDRFMEPRPVPMHDLAIPHYLEAYEFNPNSSYLNFQLGVCYINTAQKFKALDYFKKAHELNPDKHPDINFYLGKGYHLQKGWDEAIKYYKIHRDLIDSENDFEHYKEMNKLIEECGNGKVLEKNPIRVWIDNLGDSINSEYPEYGAILTADASEMFFTSRRPTSTGADPFDGAISFDEDVLTSVRDKNGIWSKATNLGKPINTKEHDAAVALSPDGSKMIIYLDDKGVGNLYESERDGSEWSKPKIFNKEISSDYYEPSAWYSSDGKQLYFVSTRPLEKRGDPKDKDIYVATWNPDKKKWLDVERLPDNVNSKYDEDGIFLHPDNKTLYFSSTGHNTMGGYDIFKTVKQPDGSWSDPENIGYPLSTPDDDIFFVVAANGRHAYMTSFREEGFGDKDLYKVTLLGEEKKPLLNSENILLASSDVPVTAKVIEPKVEIKKTQVAILKGIVRDDKTKEPLEASIELIDNQKNVIVAEFKSDAKTGKYLVSLPAGINYGIAVKAEDYLFHSENFDVSGDSDYLEVEKIIDLKQAGVGQVIVLRNIFFDLNKYSLRDESENELDRLTKLLKENPSLKIEISGHTDTRGSASYNKELSKNRAKSVVEYLIDKGIKQNRLEYKGYGLEQPIVTDAEIKKLKSRREIEAAHQENRRTEFKVLEN